MSKYPAIYADREIEFVFSYAVLCRVRNLVGLWLTWFLVALLRCIVIFVLYGNKEPDTEVVIYLDVINYAVFFPGNATPLIQINNINLWEILFTQQNLIVNNKCQYDQQS